MTLSHASRNPPENRVHHENRISIDNETSPTQRREEREVGTGIDRGNIDGEKSSGLKNARVLIDNCMRINIENTGILFSRIRWKHGGDKGMA